MTDSMPLAKSGFHGRRPALAEEPTDAQLLERFARQRDERAFTVLVRRYGAVVFGVCVRVLGDVQEAEDAAQATFLVLVRRAGSISRPELLGNWLYGVAHRIARKARARAARRAQAPVRPPTAAAPDPVQELARRELCERLDAELQRLPTKFRAPLVLCYLDGLTNEEAARRLGWPTGSISYRLARGREILFDRLRDHAALLPPAFLAALPALYSAPLLYRMSRLLDIVTTASLRLAEADAADGLASPAAHAMAQAELRRLALASWTRPLVALVLSILLLASGLLGRTALGAMTSPATAPPATGCHSGAPAGANSQ